MKHQRTWKKARKHRKDGIIINISVGIGGALVLWLITSLILSIPTR